MRALLSERPKRSNRKIQSENSNKSQLRHAGKIMFMLFRWILSFFEYQNYKNDTSIDVPTRENSEVSTAPEYVWKLFCSQFCSPAMRVALIKIVVDVKMATVPPWYSMPNISLLDVCASWDGICCCQIDLCAITEIPAAPKSLAKIHCCKIKNKQSVLNVLHVFNGSWRFWMNS